MTNGEKLEQVFPDGICPFSKSWLDYEYKEPKNKLSSGTRKKLEKVSPIIDWNNCHTSEQLEKISTTKNDLAVDAVSRQAINGYIDYILSHGMGKKKSFDFIKKFVANLPPATPQASTTKNDLAVDCISRAEAIKCLECDFDITGKENMKTVVNYINSAHDKIVNLPSVTPIRPKGHWIPIYQGDEIIDYRCSECEFGNTFGKGTIGMNFCPRCGSDNREVVEE